MASSPAQISSFCLDFYSVIFCWDVLLLAVAVMATMMLVTVVVEVVEVIR